MQVQQWKPGDKIKNDRFEILDKLGEGGFGVTYLANDHIEKRQVVIKTLNVKQQSEKDFAENQQRFRDEGFRLWGFNHAHIVKIYEPLKNNGLLGFVMEYIPGQDLEKYVKKKGGLRETEALLYIDQIAQALYYVHQEDVLHRDVNPRNIMLRHDPQEAVLIDFGLAREFVELEPIYLTNTYGSELYKPVEQYEKRGIFGPPTDIYALAVTLYHLLAGAPPGGGGWASASYTSIVRKKNHERGMGEECDRELWAELINVGVSAKTIAAIQAGMSIEPEQRPQNMTEFRELLGLGLDATPLPVFDLIENDSPSLSMPVVTAPTAEILLPGLTASIPPVAPANRVADGRSLFLPAPVVLPSIELEPATSKKNEQSVEISAEDFGFILRSRRELIEDFPKSAIEEEIATQKNSKPDDESKKLLATDYYNHDTPRKDKLKNASESIVNKSVDGRWLFSDKDISKSAVEKEIATQKISKPDDESKKLPATYYHNLGIKKLSDNDFQGALADCNKAINLDHKYVEAYFARGVLKQKFLDDWKGALADYNKVIELDPNDARAYNNRGILKAYELKNFKRALADYNKAIELNPKDASAYHNRGVLKASKLNDFKGALADYNKAIRLDPKLVYSYHSRGLLKKDKLKDTEGAIADFGKATELYRQNNDATNLQKSVDQLQQMKKVEKPKSSRFHGWNPFQQSQKKKQPRFTVKPKLLTLSLTTILGTGSFLVYGFNHLWLSAEGHYNRGVEREKHSDNSGAFNDYTKAIELDPKYAISYNNRGKLKADKLNDFKGALADYNKAIEGALADYNKAIELDPKYAIAYNNRGILKGEKLNDIKGALADYNKAIELNPKYANAYYNRGNQKENKLNDRAGAIQDFRQAVRLYREQWKKRDLQDTINRLKKLGATE